MKILSRLLMPHSWIGHWRSRGRNSAPAIIPWPTNISPRDGYFNVKGQLTIAARPPQQLGSAVEFLTKYIRSAAGATLRAASGSDFGIELRIDDDIGGASSDRCRYVLKIEPTRIILIGADAASVFCAVATLVQILLSTSGRRVPCMEIHDEASLKYRGLHLDLRAQQLSVDYIKRLIDRLALFKINLLIIEWEDKFPYQQHPLISSRYCYTPKQIKEIIGYAQDRFIEVVPLLQCLSHLTFVLKHDRYARLRETPSDVQQLCPSNANSLALFKELALELAVAHDTTSYFHIGGDEAFNLGQCDRCGLVAEAEGKSYLYATYIRAVCDELTKIGRTPVLWGDVLLRYPDRRDLLSSNLIVADWDYLSVGDDPAIIASGSGRVWTPGFGHVDDLVEAGFKVFAAPSVRSAPDGMFNIDHEQHLSNVVGYGKKAVESGLLGVLLTNWAHTGKFDYLVAESDGTPKIVEATPKTPRLALELTWLVMAVGFEYAWNINRPSINEVAGRFSRIWFGLDEKAGIAILEALRLAGVRIESVQRAEHNFEPIRESLRRIGRYTPKRNVETFEVILFSLKLAQYVCEKVIIFDQVEDCLQKGKKSRALLDRMLAMQENAQLIRNLSSQILSEIYYDYEIIYDNFKRFDADIKKMERYVAMLK